MTAARPFLRWVGGKTRLLDEILPMLPERFDDYVEPFVGGGAVFFALHAAGRITRHAYLSDANPELVATYRAIRNDVEAVIELLEDLAGNHSDHHYQAIRESDPVFLSQVGVAARMIYLNRTCFNGLYRVNSDGKFNVPIGRNANRQLNRVIVDADNLRACSAALQCAQIDHVSFDDASDVALSGDAVYFDPPYIGRKSFTQYTAEGFRFEAQRRLKATADALREDGVTVLLSNSDTPETRELYKDWPMRSVTCRRDVAAKASTRRAVSELLIGGAV